MRGNVSAVFTRLRQLPIAAAAAAAEMCSAADRLGRAAFTCTAFIRSTLLFHRLIKKQYWSHSMIFVLFFLILFPHHV